jgi:hypothetical protein
LAAESQSGVTVNRLGDAPPLILWAWERRTDLRYIDPQRVGVAYLERTLYLQGKIMLIRPRRMPLRVHSGTFLVPTARIETSRSDPPTMSDAQCEKLAQLVAPMARLPGARAIQIDFDALPSERSFYRDLLFQLRKVLPPNIPISITAPASWCSGDLWLDDLPVDEAVPLFFRASSDSFAAWRQVVLGQDFTSAVCRESIGLTVDQVAGAPARRHLYVFSPRGWSRAILQKTLARLDDAQHLASAQ